MADAMSPIADPASAAGAALGPPGVDRRRQDTESRVAEISSLLSALEEAAAESGLTAPPAPAVTAPPPLPRAERPKPVDDHENRLVQVRLGLASSLFAALRHKHAPTASHSLRVA